MYEALKGLHQVAALVWVVGAFALPLAMVRADAAGLVRLRGWASRVVTPAMPWLDPAWITLRNQWTRRFPMGVDLLLADDHHVAALPRTTRIVGGV